MTKKLAHDEVRQICLDHGYELLSQYIDNKKKLTVKCRKGHVREVILGSIKRGMKCGVCSGLARLTHEQVEAGFAAVGYRLLDRYEAPKSAKTKLKFICNNGHKHSIAWAKLQGGQRCGVCVGKYYTHEDIQRKFSDRGWQLLSKYKSSHQLLDFVCDKGHRHKMSWASFSQGTGCAYCSRRIVTNEQVQSAFKVAGYTLLDRYKDSKTKLNFICDKGHKHSIAWPQFQAGNRCAYCCGNIVTNDQVKAAFSDAGYTLLDEYKGNKTKLKFICDKGHRHSMTWGLFQTGGRCAHCAINGYKMDLPGTLYYVRFDVNGKSFYKIGITNLSAKARFAGEKTPYTILAEKRFLFGFLAHEEEQRLLKIYKRYQYKGPLILKSGNTELFTKDVLSMDKGA